MSNGAELGLSLHESDWTLLLDVLSTNSSLSSTAFAVKIIEAATSYPIEGVTELHQLFEGNPAIQVGSCSISFEQVTEFLPEECFPIHSRIELISKVLMAFERERMTAIHAIATRQGHEVGWEV